MTTIIEAVLHDGGEARTQRARFEALSKDQQNEIVEFLKQLQVLPNDSPREVGESDLKAPLKSQKSVNASTVLLQPRE